MKRRKRRGYKFKRGFKKRKKKSFRRKPIRGYGNSRGGIRL